MGVGSGRPALEQIRILQCKQHIRTDAVVQIRILQSRILQIRVLVVFLNFFLIKKPYIGTQYLQYVDGVN